MNKGLLQTLCAHKQLILYLFFGCCTTLVSIGSFLAFHSALKVHELLANVFSWVLAVSFAYVTNRKWVFHSQAQGSAVLQEMTAFYVGRLATLGFEEGLLLVFVTWLDFPGTPIKLAAQIIVLIGNYVISKLLIFRKKETN